MVKTWFGDVYMTTYPVQCARIMELASLAYFTAGTKEDQERHSTFIRELLDKEPGCAHPISDRSTISIVLATLVLIGTGHSDDAAHFLEKATVWLCDRYQDGMGLAGVEADEQSETNMLLGYPFEFINAAPRHDSFLATALMDLAAFLGEPELYGDIVNDVKAVRIHAEYWQARDTVGACRFEGDDVFHYPSVEFADVLRGHAQEYAEHFIAESEPFRFVEVFGPVSAIAIAALLRDRYFPKVWPMLASGIASRFTNTAETAET